MAKTLSRIDDLPELDLESFREDPAATLDALRPHRIVRSTRGVEILAYDLAHQLLGDQRLRPMSADDFSSRGASPYIAEFVDKGIFLFMQPERHREIRKVFMRGFGGKQLINVRNAITETCDVLVDRLLAKGTGDLVEDFTVRLSSQALCRVVGFPTHDIPKFLDDALELRKLAAVPIQPHVPSLEAALRRLHSYATDLLAERRRAPQDDFLSALIDAEQAQGRLTNDELIWGTVNLLLGGIDTTNFQLSSTLHHLITRDLWEIAASDATIRDLAIEEAMRLSPVPTQLGRIVHEPLEVDGVELPLGANVKINLVAAGRDPIRFDDPHSYRLDRAQPIFPLLFGNGIHTCIGRNLAWQELRSGTEALTARLTAVAFTAEPTMRPWTEAKYGACTLPIRFRARPMAGQKLAEDEAGR